MKDLQDHIKIYEFTTKTKTLETKEYELTHLRDSH